MNSSTLAILVALAFPVTARAIVFISTADPDHNTSEPQGALAGSGWQWQGNWGGFLGTAIGPHQFISAGHIGGTVGDLFVFRGVSYATTAVHADPTSDLRIWELSGTLPDFAPLYRTTNETGRPLVVFGRGGTRGMALTVTNGVTTATQGWLWAGGDGRMRWGENVISSVIDGGTGLGNLLRVAFDAGSGSNEAHLAAGDSAGAVFIQDQGVWKLAGINYAVDGRFNFTSVGEGFDAALFDVGGLYHGTSGNWNYVANQPYNIPSSFYATRISDHVAWIDSVVSPASGAGVTDVPLLSANGIILLFLLILSTGVIALEHMSRFRRRSAVR